MTKKISLLILLTYVFAGCNQPVSKEATSTKDVPFFWENANLYFLLIDRFNNGNPTNDINFERTKSTAVLRGFEGGDLKGITQKINTGYFSDLGINAIWMTPVVEQNHGIVDEGTGATYGYHGYWTQDWTAIDPNFGTRAELQELVDAAHKKGIRIVLDAVINHTGPVTEKDPVWPKNWVIENPLCDFKNYQGNTKCALVKNLPDIKTDSNENVELPSFLIEKWKKEGRYDQEIKELDAFFERTGYPKAPRFYIIKWLSDYIADFGIDGYRCDTVKHTEPYVWKEFRKECDYAFANWKQKNPEKVLDNNPFYLTGEVYYYFVSPSRLYDYGDKKVDYYNYGFNSLINFDLKNSHEKSYEEVFSQYSSLINGSYKNYGFLNYMTSHDDASPFDKTREKPYETASRLLLCGGTSQIYYGDELARGLIIEGTQGDATLRSSINWDRLKDAEVQKIRTHWQKLSKFRKKHPSIGMGIHKMISESPYVFQRTLSNTKIEDAVVVGLDLPVGEKLIPVGGIFENGTKLTDSYSGKEVIVNNGKVSLSSEYNIVLLEK